MKWKTRGSHHLPQSPPLSRSPECGMERKWSKCRIAGAGRWVGTRSRPTPPILKQRLAQGSIIEEKERHNRILFDPRCTLHGTWCWWLAHGLCSAAFFWGDFGIHTVSFAWESSSLPWYFTPTSRLRRASGIFDRLWRSWSYFLCPADTGLSVMMRRLTAQCLSFDGDLPRVSCTGRRLAYA